MSRDEPCRHNVDGMPTSRWKAISRLWAPPIVTILAIAAAIVFQQRHTEAARDDPLIQLWFWLWIAFAIVAGGIPLVDAAIRQQRRKSAADQVRSAREEQVVAINDALDPLVEKLGELVLTAPRTRPAIAQKLLIQALNSASQVIGPERTRVNYFQADAAAEPYRLICKESAGRHTKPTTVFTQGRPDGDWVIGLLSRDEPYLCESVKEDPPPGWDSSRSRTYETFISVPASVGSESVGMITADAPRKGDLKEQDIPLIRVIGTIIAASIKIAEGAADPGDQNRGGQTDVQS